MKRGIQVCFLNACITDLRHSLITHRATEISAGKQKSPLVREMKCKRKACETEKEGNKNLISSTDSLLNRLFLFSSVWTNYHDLCCCSKDAPPDHKAAWMLEHQALPVEKDKSGGRTS